MKIAKLLSIAGTLVMFFTLIYGFTQGDFWGEGSILMNMAWGKVSLIDVYVGFFLFSGWVWFREPNTFNALLWIVSIMVLGNFLCCLYATVALFRSNNDWKIFWMGNR